MPANAQDILIRNLEEIVGTSILSISPISGGDINQAWKAETDSGPLFVKHNTAHFASEMFDAEAKGLKLLAASKTFILPNVLAQEGPILVLEFIEQGQRDFPFWENFGESLANLHRETSPHFGLDHSNFIGSLPQSNLPHSTWAEFYVNERLQPQARLAFDANLLQKRHVSLLENLYKELPSICPEESPALIHGDLWSGNFLVSKTNAPVLVDPSVCYAHREMDLAMSRLFGGFDRGFYSSYANANPLEPGFEKRLPILQLYYLLVHVNLFGGGYVNSVQKILSPFTA